jgi:hypothetical protein
VKVVEVLGKQKAMDIFNKTRKIEEDGGMMVLVCSLKYFCLEGFVFSNCLKCRTFLKGFMEGKTIVVS